MQGHLGNVVPGWTAPPVEKLYTTEGKHGSLVERHPLMLATPSKLPNHEINCSDSEHCVPGSMQRRGQAPPCQVYREGIPP